MVFENTWIIPIVITIGIFLFYFITKRIRRHYTIFILAIILLPLTFYFIYTYNPITVGNNQTPTNNISNCSIIEERGSSAYLNFKYKDNKLCKISPDGVSWKVICKEGIC